MAAAFHGAGACVSREEFAVRARVVREECLEVEIGGAWRPFACSLFSSAPCTQGVVEAPLVFFESSAEYRRPTLDHLTGAAVVHLGCHIESRAQYRRLMEAQPACLLMVDTRYPADVPLADGLFPSYVRDIGAVSTVNVAFQDAWRWKVEGAERIRLLVRGGPEPSLSGNVVAELPGEDEDSGILYLGAHHDTQAHSPGADDNASGVAGLLELARALRAVPRRRAVRLISFGAEEQLSVGSAEYVRHHRDEIVRRGVLMFNLDSYASAMGWSTIVCNGAPELAAHAAAVFARHDLYPAINSATVPYADHFPFAAAGLSSLYLGRDNCAGGRFFHHRPDDDLTRVSVPVMRRHLEAVADFVAELAAGDPLPFPPGLPEDQRAPVQAFWDDLFGGWTG